MKKKLQNIKSSQERLDESLLTLWRLRKEICAYAVLFQKLDASGLDSDSLLGVGIAFEDMSKKLDGVTNNLNQIFEHLEVRQ